MELDGNRNRARVAGKQRRLSMTSQPELTLEPSGTSRVSRSGSEKSVGQDFDLGTPGKKTTRDRRLVSARDQALEMPQCLVPLVCTAFRNALWVVAWQKGLGPMQIFSQTVTEMPTTVKVENCLKMLYLDSFLMRLIPDVLVMPRILFGPAESKIKFFTPLVDARISEQKVAELELQGMRLLPMSLFTEAKKHELAKFMISPIMVTADAIGKLKLRLPKDKKMESNFLKSALTQSWPVERTTLTPIQRQHGVGLGHG
ncbi:hypothetical protein CBR_g63086 [Chara braunii]|uniref:Uncharacterized protein n=1 Tax=Chara braunii TaxID=69332 RepID=A0A388K992_CHABU|nr:hypothetical protein CBR_g63086 [Chara braunii]|eukprot:GBG66503.1 hypothetical protein CBR_g63086 [Chara braunii]